MGPAIGVGLNGFGGFWGWAGLLPMHAAASMVGYLFLYYLHPIFTSNLFNAGYIHGHSSV